MGLDETIDDLSLNPAFAGFDRAALRKLAQCAEARLFLPREILFRQGDPSHGSFLITTGSLQLSRGVGDAAMHAHVGRGTLVGTKALLMPIPRPVTATARETTSALFISRHVFQTILQNFPSGAAAMQEVLIQALRDMMQDFRMTTFRDAA
ncbi:Crp/Fnr family transcriptional regulator [Beijerinckia indica]|uniref:Cyclic nucleotide-binding protein n=1 Tax=Beijerinckia indica subsp. indica (strain ATCC 9039 / DSM 1715 / NCIMB 8712) TaxID=395963 RepID=B2ICJ7_BEII9|nr:cyclic nucleotide-binding domain-containing protein [Beijerinckia indica]ACB93886.1 cyclic nucleotide-binding protein [Beijerinckia indica subsp. indica ATCC 9039]